MHYFCMLINDFTAIEDFWFCLLWVRVRSINAIKNHLIEVFIDSETMKTIKIINGMKNDIKATKYYV